MKHRKRIYCTDSQKALMWDRWQRGEPMNRIAALFDQHAGFVHNILIQHGGIRPSLRRRSPLALSLAEREGISRGLEAGGPIRVIAASLERALSTVSREIACNGGLISSRAR